MTDAVMTFGLPAYPAYYMENDDLANERAIVDRLIRGGLERGYLVSVSDGEEWALSKSSDYAAITAEVAATDTTILRFTDPAQADRINGRGSFLLIHGNDLDVVADYSDNKMTVELLSYATGEDYIVSSEAHG